MNESKEKTVKSRPCWHVDMKWVVGLIFIPVLAVTMLALGLYTMTTRDNAVRVSGAIMKAMFAPANRTNSNEIDTVRKAIAESPDKALHPFPGTDIKITSADLDRYTPDQLKNNLFRELASTIYDGSSSTLSGKTLQDNFSKLGLMAILTKDGHDQIGSILIYPVLISILLLAALIYFSSGFGRLISPGVISIMVGLPSILLFTVLQKQPVQSTAAGELSFQQGIAQFVSAIGPTVSGMFMKNYVILLIAGLVLLFTGIIGRIVQRIRTHRVAAVEIKIPRII